MVDPQPSSQEPQTPTGGRKMPLRERLRLYVIWVIQYWRELFNFRFDKYMIIQVLPGVYGLSLVALALTILYVCADALFAHQYWRAVFYIFIAGPLAFLVLASTLRALLEFYIVVFRISEHVDELIGIRDTVDKLSGISETVDEMANLTRRIPFWSLLSGRRRARGQVPESRRRKDGEPDAHKSKAGDKGESGPDDET